VGRDVGPENCKNLKQKIRLEFKTQDFSLALLSSTFDGNQDEDEDECECR
jgi:hypothetical protein